MPQLHAAAIFIPSRTTAQEAEKGEESQTQPGDATPWPATFHVRKGQGNSPPRDPDQPHGNASTPPQIGGGRQDSDQDQGLQVRVGHVFPAML